MPQHRVFALVIFFMGVLASLGARAQSFDCTQAGLNLTEHTICQSSDLSQKDSELDRLWNLLNAHDQRVMKFKQNNWQAERNSCGPDFNCLIRSYDERIADLLEVLEDQPTPSLAGALGQSLGGNVRNGPGTNHYKIVSLGFGEPVSLMENTGVFFNGYPWFKIQFRGGQNGYQWGGILCGVGVSISGVYQRCASAPVTPASPAIPQPTPPPGKPIAPQPSVMTFASFDVARDSVDRGYPKNTDCCWPGLWTDQIDSALKWPNGKVQFFSGNLYTRFDVNTGRADPGYPKRIDANTWPGLWTAQIDAAFNAGNGKAYFFNAGQYIRYDIAADRADAGYPKPVNDNTWPGLGSLGQIDSVVNAGNGKAYFFSGLRYVRYDIASDRADPGYPKPVDNRNWPGLGAKEVSSAHAARGGKIMFFHYRQ